MKLLALMPWNKRVEEERQRRLDAEFRRDSAEKDWALLNRHRKSIDREIELNDWTATAIAMFSGRNSK